MCHVWPAGHVTEHLPASATLIGSLPCWVPRPPHLPPALHARPVEVRARSPDAPSGCRAGGAHTRQRGCQKSGVDQLRGVPAAQRSIDGTTTGLTRRRAGAAARHEDAAAPTCRQEGKEGGTCRRGCIYSGKLVSIHTGRRDAIEHDRREKSLSFCAAGRSRRALRLSSRRWGVGPHRRWLQPAQALLPRRLALQVQLLYLLGLQGGVGEARVGLSHNGRMAGWQDGRMPVPHRRRPQHFTWAPARAAPGCGPVAG